MAVMHEQRQPVHPRIGESLRSIPILARHRAVRRAASAKHLAQVARERLRLLERGEVPAPLVARLEDDLPDRVRPPARAMRQG